MCTRSSVIASGNRSRNFIVSGSSSLSSFHPELSLVLGRLDFGLLPEDQAKGLTDYSLQQFLEVINASNVTMSLSLRGCTSVEGYGLEPLRRSKILEVLGLRRTQEEIDVPGNTGLANEYIISLLRTMPPFSGLEKGLSGLKLVFFRHQYETDKLRERHSKPIKGFYNDLRLAVMAQALQHRAPCRSCLAALEDCVPEEDFEMFANLSYCPGCKTYDCTPLLPCFICEFQKCVDCDGPIICYQCEESFCEECRFTFPCDDCRANYCVSCREPANCAR